MQAHTHDVELAIVQHSRRPPPTGIWRAARHIYLHEGGLPGLYRGVWPTTVRAAILTASQLPGGHGAGGDGGCVGRGGVGWGWPGAWVAGRRGGRPFRTRVALEGSAAAAAQSPHTQLVS